MTSSCIQSENCSPGKDATLLSSRTLDLHIPKTVERQGAGDSRGTWECLGKRAGEGERKGEWIWEYKFKKEKEAEDSEQQSSGRPTQQRSVHACSAELYRTHLHSQPPLSLLLVLLSLNHKPEAWHGLSGHPSA